MNRCAALGVMGTFAIAGCDVRRIAAHAFGRGGACVDLAPPAAANVALTRGALPGTYAPAPVRYCIVVPIVPKPVTAVAYLLPGRGSTAETAIDVLGIGHFLADYVRQGGTPFAIAALDAGESYFHHRASGEDRLAAATVALPQIVRALVKAPLREALIGQSMGGYGALLAAETEPHRYRAVAVAGPAIFPSYADERGSVGDAFDSAADYAAHDVIAHAAVLRHLPVHISVGRSDPFLPGVRLFARASPSAEVDVRDGCHDDGFWRASAPALIAFVGRALA